MRKILSIIIGCLILCGWGNEGIAQGTQTEFGKNRVQYHDFDWWQYETEDFIVYWYQGGRNIGQFVAQMADSDYDEIKNLLEYRISDKLEILVYNDLTDLKQSNVGNEEVFLNTNGVTKIVDNKLFVYFDGNHNNLRKQIREGIAQVYLNYMMFGGNLQEIVQNAVLLNLPNWYTQGLVSYAGEEWNIELDNRMKDAILTQRYTTFMDAIKEDPTFAGHAFWYFIAQNYGKSTVSNLLYLTRINRSVESGFLYVLGGSFQQMGGNWLNFYQSRYKIDQELGTPLVENEQVTVKNKRNIPLSQLKISPNGKQIAYVSNELGKQKVYLQNVNTGERKIIYKSGSKNIFQATDYNYPILAWMPNGNTLGVIYEKRDNVAMLVYDTRDDKKQTIDIPSAIDDYQRILSAEFINARQMIFTAIKNGFSDIYMFDTKVRQTKAITRDYHDNLDATYTKINGVKGIIFASNRQSDSVLVKGEKLDSLLPINTYDLYFYNMDKKNNTELVQLTYTPYTNERKPIAINDRYFAFTSDYNGIENRYIGYIDTIFAYREKVVKIKGEPEEIIIHVDSTYNTAPENIDTVFIRDVYKPKGFSFANSNFNRNIVEQHIAPKTGKIATVFYNNGKHQFYLQDVDTTTKVLPNLSAYQAQTLRLISKKRTALKKQQEQITQQQEKVREEKQQEIPQVETPQDTVPKTTAQDTGKIDIDNYFFHSEFEDEPAPTKTVIVDDKDKSTTVQKVENTVTNTPIQLIPKQVLKFRPSRITTYRTKFKTDYVTTQLDNSLLFGGLQPINPNEPFFDYPVPNILLLGSVDDLFEDRRLQGGIRIPTIFNGVEYFVTYSDLKNRLDKRYAFYRRMRRGSGGVDPALSTIPLPPSYEASYKTISNIAEVQLKYPLDIFRSVRATVTARTDRQLFLATDIIGLGLPDVTQQRVGVRGEYVFDNTLDVSTNIKNGTRAKAFAEVQKRFNLSFQDGVSLDFNEGLMGILGLDARHYLRIDKHSILAGRAAFATSFGSEKILYYLGGTDNWLRPSFNTDIPTPDLTNFAFQTIAANLRGFSNNIRNGNSYALINIEGRFPIINYLARKPITNSFLKNLQVVPFFDVGTAWQGISPFDDENPLNTIVIQNPNSPVSVQVNYFRNPVVAGYGVGLRSTLFGYFVRLDYAWGIETGVVQDPRFYLSLGTDF